MAETTKLTVKQEKFCNAYIETGNASEAYRRSYDCTMMRDEVISVKASELLSNGKITVRVKELQGELKSRSNITKEQVLAELAKIAFSSMAHYYLTWTERKDFESLTEEAKACIKSISTKVMKKNVGTSDCPEIVDVEYVKIELYDKLKALENINKMLGFDAPIKNEHTSKDGVPLLPISREQARKIMENL